MGEEEKQKLLKEDVKESQKQKKTRICEESERETKKLKNCEAKTKEEQQNWKKVVGISVAGAIFTVLIGIAIQAIYIQYVIDPAKEKQFINSAHSEITNFEKNMILISSENNIFNVYSIPESQSILKLQILSEETNEVVPFQDLDWFQHQEGDGSSFGKFQYQYKHLVVTVKYVIQSINEIFLTIDASGIDHFRNNATHNIVVSQGGNIKEFTLFIVDQFQEDFSFPTNDYSNSGKYEHIKGLHNNISEKYYKQFEDIFQLKQKNIPGFYQEMGKSALSSVLHSYYYSNYTKFFGSRNGHFVSDMPSFIILSNEKSSIERLDAQVAPLLLAITADEQNVKKVLSSWFSKINDHGEMANFNKENGLKLGKIQAPVLFIALRSLVKNEKYTQFLNKWYSTIKLIYDETWKNSVGKGNNNFQWIETSSLFGTQEVQHQSISSFELRCLIEFMNLCMAEISEIVGQPAEKYRQQANILNESRISFWNSSKNQFGDINKENKLIDSETAEFAAIILGLLDKDSEILSKSLIALENHKNWKKMGYQISDESGASIFVNYLLLGSLKKYSEQSGPSQHKAHILYSVLKNNIIAHVARSFKNNRSFYQRYNSDGVGIGTRNSNDGSLILLIMAEIFYF